MRKEAVPIQIKMLQSFLKLCQERNISKASKGLYISQQGLSRQMQMMERELGVQLFERGPSGLTLTEAGGLLRPYLQHAWSSYEEGLAALEHYRMQQNGTVQVGLCHGVTLALGLDFILKFRAAYPEIQIKLQELQDGDCLDMLLHGELDAAFLVEPFDLKPFSSFPVFACESCAVLHKDHPLSQKRQGLLIKDLDAQPVLIVGTQYHMRRMFDAECRLRDIHPNILLATGEITGYLNLPLEQPGVIALSVQSLCRNIDPQLVVLPILDLSQWRIQFCAKRESLPSQATRTFARYIKSSFGESMLSKGAQ